jgi:acyl carrier protein
MPTPSISANPDIFASAGEDRSLTIVAFTGGARLLLLRPFDFMDVTGVMRYGRILVRDPTKSWFHLGFGEEGGNFESVMQSVRGLLAELKGEKLMTIGTSMGGYAALLAGHLLKADYVHAFSPQTYLDAASIDGLADSDLGHRANLDGVHAVLGKDAEILDLRRVLRQPNGKTRYFIHVCSGHAPDLRRAEHVEGLPQVAVLRYPCRVHNVLIGMSHKRFLRTALTPEAQDTLVERHARIFSGTEPKAPGPRNKMDTALQEPLDRVGAIVASVGRERVAFKEIMECKDLLARLSLDSMNVLEIIVGLENEFGVEVDPESVVVEDFRTVASILAIVWAAPGSE